MVLQVFLIIFYLFYPDKWSISIIDYSYHHIPIRSISEIQKNTKSLRKRNRTTDILIPTQRFEKHIYSQMLYQLSYSERMDIFCKYYNT